LTVTDNNGGVVSTTERTITVTAPAQPPAETGITAPASTPANTPVAILSGVTVSGKTIVSRTWSITPNRGIQGSLSNVGGTLRFLFPGTYTINLTLTDSSGQTHEVSRTILVGQRNLAPTARYRFPANAAVDTPVAFVCQSTDRDGTIANRAWTITPSIGVIQETTANGATLTFDAPGSYIIRLRVTDNNGRTGSKSRIIIIRDPSLR